MKKLKGFGVFFIIAGLIIAICGMIALMMPGSLPISAGPTLTAGILVTLLGVVTIISVHAQDVSAIPDHR